MADKPRVVGDTPIHTLIVDWDGTAVPAQWPERPTSFMPGFVESMHAFNARGYKLVISTARLNPRDPWTGEMRPQDVMDEERQYIRDTLDKAGLTFVRIHDGLGKPGGSVYIDDKAERYNGTNNSWRRLTEKIILRLENEDAMFPDTDEEEVPLAA